MEDEDDATSGKSKGAKIDVFEVNYREINISIEVTENVA